MPNWCDNNLKIHGTKEKIEEIKKVIEEHSKWGGEGHPKEYKCKYPKLDGTPMGFLHYCKPEPDYTTTPVAKTYPEIGAKYAKTEAEREKRLENKPTIRDDSWWDWRIQNWGTKWEITFDWVGEDGDEEVILLSFQSAWAPPIDAYKALFTHEGITGIEATYYEPGCTFAGRFIDGKNTCFDTSSLTKDDFEKNETIWELDDCFELKRDIMQCNPLQLHPELEPILRGLEIEDCWEVDSTHVLKIYETLKDKTITPGSVQIVSEEGTNWPTHFTFNSEEYEL